MSEFGLWIIAIISMLVFANGFAKKEITGFMFLDVTLTAGAGALMFFALLQLLIKSRIG